MQLTPQLEDSLCFHDVCSTVAVNGDADMEMDCSLLVLLIQLYSNFLLSTWMIIIYYFQLNSLFHEHNIPLSSSHKPSQSDTPKTQKIRSCFIIRDQIVVALNAT